MPVERIVGLNPCAKINIGIQKNIQFGRKVSSTFIDAVQKGNNPDLHKLLLNELKGLPGDLKLTTPMAPSRSQVRGDTELKRFFRRKPLLVMAASAGSNQALLNTWLIGLAEELTTMKRGPYLIHKKDWGLTHREYMDALLLSNGDTAVIDAWKKLAASRRSGRGEYDNCEYVFDNINEVDRTKKWDDAFIEYLYKLGGSNAKLDNFNVYGKNLCAYTCGSSIIHRNNPLAKRLLTEYLNQSDVIDNALIAVGNIIAVNPSPKNDAWNSLRKHLMPAAPKVALDIPRVCVPILIANPASTNPAWQMMRDSIPITAGAVIEACGTVLRIHPKESNPAWKLLLDYAKYDSRECVKKDIEKVCKLVRRECGWNGDAVNAARKAMRELKKIAWTPD